MPEATVYLQGHVKRDPLSGTVAIRTMFDDDPAIPVMAGQAWLTATSNRGAHFAPTSVVESWDDLYVPVGDAGPTPDTSLPVV